MSLLGDETDATLIQARRGLLDAVTALGPHASNLVLVGAQAIYVHTQDERLGVALFTKDADVMFIPPVETAVDLGDALRAAGFSPGPQPGIWLNADRQVDLLVPDGLSPAPGRRAARLPGQDSRLARNVPGLEGAAVDNDPIDLTSLDDKDRRQVSILVAGPAALLVAKLWKLDERAEAGGSRLVDKDAFDTYRLLRLPAARVVRGFRRMASDDVAGPVAERGLSMLEDLFASEAAIGAQMAGRYVEGVGDPQNVRAAAAALAAELLRAVRSPS